jgi:hypothetical protein
MMLKKCHFLKIVELRFHERVQVAYRYQVWCAVNVIVYFFVVVCQSVSCVCQVFCYRMAIDMFTKNDNPSRIYTPISPKTYMPRQEEKQDFYLYSDGRSSKHLLKWGYKAGSHITASSIHPHSASIQELRVNIS